MEEIEIEIGTGNSIREINELNQEMDLLRGQMATASGKEFVELSNRASDLNAEIQRTNSTVTASGSAFTNFNTMLGRTSASLLTLDFGQAAEQAQALQSISQKLTFKSLITGVKQATTAFKTMGKAILSNPIFLIASIILAVGVAVYKLLEELGLLEPMLEAIGAVFDFLMIPINALIDGLKALTDWFGWTSNAADEAAEKEAKAQERRKEAALEANRALQKEGARELAMMKARGDSIEDIEDKEIELMELRVKEEKIDIDRDKRFLQRMIDRNKALGINTDELEARLRQITDTEKDLENELEVLKTNVSNNRKKREEEDTQKSIEEAQKRADEIKEIEQATSDFIKDIDRKRKDRENNNIEDEIEREKQLQLTKLERAKEDIDFSKMNAEAKVKWDQWEKSERERIENEAKVKREEQIKKEEEDEEARLRKQAEIERNINKTESELKREAELEAKRKEFEKDLEIAEGNAELTKQLEEKLQRELFEIKDNWRKEDEKEEEENRKKDYEQRRKALSENISMTESAFGAIGSLMTELSKGNEAAQKRQFKIQKAFNLASAITNTAMAVSAALSTGGNVAKAAMGTQFVEAGIAATMGAAQIAKIAGTKFEGGGGGGGGGGGNIGGGGMGGGVTPSMNIQGSQPSFSNFNDDLAGDITATTQGAFILESQLSSNEEKQNQLKLKKSL